LRKQQLVLFALVPALVIPVAARAGGEIYATIETDRGERFTGPVRWDKNENFWDDMLDGEKDRAIEVRSSREDIRIFGLSISRSGGRHEVRAQLSIPFGEISEITPKSGNANRVLLRNGEEIVMRNSADIGKQMRGLVIADTGGEVDLEWPAVERVTFSSGPGEGRDALRLYGTVETGQARFTGFIVWDKDESLATDILDGEEDGRNYKIPFEKIDSIERRGRNGSRVVLRGGRAVDLTDSNDVNDENRGITVTIPGLGSVDIEWDEFRSVAFTAVPASRTYDSFDGGHRLHGTVVGEDGREYTGTIRWDDDEEWSWEPLDGNMVGVTFAVLFENIQTIERESRDAARVTLSNGGVYVLDDSNDVNEDNKGIFILDGKDEVKLSWAAFRSVTFTSPR